MLVRTNIYLPEEMIVKLKSKAKMRKKSMSELVREAIVDKQASRTDRTENSLKNLLRMARRAKSSGLEDLSKKHDYYLYDTDR